MSIRGVGHYNDGDSETCSSENCCCFQVNLSGLDPIPNYPLFQVSSTSTSSSSIIPKTTVKLSMKPFTATRNILLVDALYSVRKTVLSRPELELGAMRDIERHTSGESSLSTCKACKAEEARRAVGRGMSITLFGS